MEHTYYWGPHLHWFWIIPLLFMVLMFVCAFRMFRRAGSWRRGSWRRTGWQSFGCCVPGRDLAERRSTAAPGEILDQRYARGEITKEQYKQMKNDIDSQQLNSSSEDDSTGQ